MLADRVAVQLSQLKLVRLGIACGKPGQVDIVAPNFVLPASVAGLFGFLSLIQLFRGLCGPLVC